MFTVDFLPAPKIGPFPPDLQHLSDSGLFLYAWKEKSQEISRFWNTHSSPHGTGILTPPPPHSWCNELLSHDKCTSVPIIVTVVYLFLPSNTSLNGLNVNVTREKRVQYIYAKPLMNLSFLYSYSRVLLLCVCAFFNAVCKAEDIFTDVEDFPKLWIQRHFLSGKKISVRMHLAIFWYSSFCAKVAKSKAVNYLSVCCHVCI